MPKAAICYRFIDHLQISVRMTHLHTPWCLTALKFHSLFRVVDLGKGRASVELFKVAQRSPCPAQHSWDTPLAHRSAMGSLNF